ncbi:hypothetical protein [Larkinella humicola]|uniref:Uncharacterized protein n=1 Tax=Larkinella humicola TaxID=2607654 RepID=A0A5N1JBF9_9BACT|nr:hypothetical protein [Larkinella humicola]KAA9349745.1 hypothetical protein F0P93_20040 [Larkinella humicola]
MPKSDQKVLSITTVPVSGLWLVGRYTDSEEGEQFKEKVHLLHTILWEGENGDLPHVTYRLVTLSDIQDDGYSELDSSYDSSRYIGVIDENENFINLDKSENLPVS